MKKIRPEYIAVITIFALSLSLRVWLLDKRWINPDEGAHLMDAFLTLQGYIPHVDFNSRQPFYVLVNAIWLKLFGVNYLTGRLFPITCSLLTGIFVFFIAKKLFNESVAFLAAAIYLLMPLEILNSVLVKTEPLANLLACLSVFFLLKYSDDRKKSFLLFSGVVAALGYYVRQSALTLPAIAIFYIITNREFSFTEAVRSMSVYLIGYCLVVLSFFAFYSQFYSLEQIVFGGLDPGGFILKAGRKVWYLLIHTPTSGGLDYANELIGTKTKHSLRYFKLTVYLHSFLLIGIIWGTVRTFLSPGTEITRQTFSQRSFLFLVLWTGLLAAAYVYYYKVFGYYIDYFRELLPVLSILFAAFIWETIFYKSSYRTILFFVVLSLIGFTALFFIGKLVIDIPKGIQIIGVLGIVAIVILRRGKFRRRLKVNAIVSVASLVIFYCLVRAFGWTPKIIILIIVAGGIVVTTFLFAKNRLGFLNICLVLSLLALSATFSGKTLGLRYDTPYSNEAVRRISTVIEENSSISDEVLSGAVIWEFNSKRRPFEMISHPLAYIHKMPGKVVTKLERGIKESPPQIVVLDGYTEKIYMKHLDWMPELLKRKYKLILKDDRAKYPLRVYKLEEDG